MEAIALSQGLGAWGWGLGKSPAAPIALDPRLHSFVPSPQPLGTSPSPATSHQPPAPALREVFNDFVGQTFFGELLKQMRATVDKPAYFHGGLGEEIFQAQMDQILVERMSDVTGPTFSEPMFELLMARRP